MYTNINFKTKKAFKDAIARGEKITLFAPGLGKPTRDGTETVEGPHYPEPHKWYGVATVRDGLVIGVK